MSEGWLKLNRRMLDWEWLSDGTTTQFFIYCLLRANHAPAKWRGIPIACGEFATSLGHISNDLGLSVQQVRTCIKKLKSTGEITSRTTSKNTLISITNWEYYQHGNKQDNTEITNEQHRNNIEITTNKNDKKEKKEKNVRNILDFSGWPSMPNDQLMEDWKSMRRQRKLPMTQTVINGYAKELKKAADIGYTVDQCLTECVVRGWQGFKVEWLTGDRGQGPQQKQQKQLKPL